jgi:hypothetical protein
MKKIISITITILLLAGITACSDKSGASDDPNLGVWKAVTGEMFGLSMKVEEYFGKGFTIELKAKDKCALNIDGEKANGTWTLNNGAFTVKGGGLDCAGRLENGTLTLENVLGMGMTLVFEKEGGIKRAAAEAPSEKSIETPAAGDAGYYVIDSVTQDGETYDAAMLKEIGISYYLLLNEDGTMLINTDNAIEGTWKKGVLSYSEDGEEVISKYTLDGDLITINIGDDSITLVFKRSSGTPPAKGSSSSDSSGSETSAGLSDGLAWWDGDWYGYWTVVSADDPYIDMKGEVWDCYAIINAYDDDTATIFVFDDDISIGEVYVDIGFDGYGYGIMGAAISTGGSLFGGVVEYEDWTISPGNSDYEDMIEIDEWHEDSDGDRFRYKVYLRPWGTLWDDVPSAERPPYYDDWYLGVRDMTMDDAIDSLSGDSGSSAGGGSTANGTAVSTEVDSMGGKKGAMSAVCPDGWFDHSAPDLMSGFLQFSVSEDDPWSDECIQIRSSWMLSDTLEESLIYEGTPISYTFGGREWVGVEERDGLGYVEVVTDIGEDCYVSVYFQGLDTRNEIITLILQSFQMKWN